MIIHIIINSSDYFKKDVEISIQWNIPFIPRVGESIHPMLIINQDSFSVDSFFEALTENAKENCMSFIKRKQKNFDVCFKDWIEDVLNTYLVRDIKYAPIKKNSIDIIPQIYLDDE